MGIRVLRVPGGFNWPIGETWWGATLPCVACETCGGSGAADWGSYGYCDTCGGEGEVSPSVPIPGGDHWQLWETTTEGSPISPVFSTSRALAVWCAEHEGAPFHDFETWHGWITQDPSTHSGMRARVAAAGGGSRGWPR